MEIKLQFPQKGWNFNFALTKVFLTIRHFQNALNEHEKVNRTELTQNLHFKKAFLDPPFPFVTMFSYPRPPNVITPNKTNLSSKMETIKYILILIYDAPHHKFNHKQMDKYWDTDSFSVPKQKNKKTCLVQVHCVKIRTRKNSVFGPFHAVVLCFHKPIVIRLRHA